MRAPNQEPERQLQPDTMSLQSRFLWCQLNGTSARIQMLSLSFSRLFLLLRLSCRARDGVASPLAAKLKTALSYLVCALLPFILTACEGDDTTPPGASRDPITSEIRLAIEAGDLAALSAFDLPEIPGVGEFIINHD